MQTRDKFYKTFLSWVIYEYPKVSTDKTLNIKVQTGFKCFKSNRHSRPLYIYFLTFQYSWQKICSFDNFANDWIRTNELWCRKWPLCRLRHSHCPPMANLEVVNYDSRQFSSQCNASIVNYDCKVFIRLTTGLLGKVMTKEYF